MLRLTLLALLVGCSTDLPSREDAHVSPDAPLDSPDARVQDAEIDVGVDSAPTDGSEPDALDAGHDAGDPSACRYETLVEMPGVFHTVTEAMPALILRPFAAGEGFRCLRMEFSLQTADNIDRLISDFEGCPVFIQIAEVAHDTRPGWEVVYQVADFRFRRTDCTPRVPRSVQLVSTLAPEGAGPVTVNGPWEPGQRYDIIMAVERDTFWMELRQDGGLVVPRIEGAVADFQPVDTTNPRIFFGRPQIFTNAFYPYYDAQYVDLVIQADRRTL